MASCNTCAVPVKQHDKIIICSKCDRDYHQTCVKLSATAFEKLKKQNALSKWKCPNCLPAKKKSGKPTAEAEKHRPDVDKFKDTRRKHRPDEKASSDGKDNKSNDIRDEIRNILRVEVRNMTLSGFADVKTQIGELKRSDAYDISRITDMKAKLKGAQRDNIELRTKISEMIKTVSQLNASVNALDQSMREANIEIYGLPELKNGKLSAIVIKLARVVSYELKDSDILKCVRVANDRVHPRSVVVKLHSARCRDELYAAAIRYNKAHPDDTLNTTVLGYAGKKMPVYVTEHYSPMYQS